MEVYVVVDASEPDEFEVVGVFSTQERAEAFRGGAPEQLFPIEGREVDSLDGRTLRPVWEGWVRLSPDEWPGRIEPSTSYRVLGGDEVVVERGEPCPTHFRDGDVWQSLCASSVSPDHFRRLAEEARERWMSRASDGVGEANRCG